MPLLAATNLQHAFGNDVILDGVSLSVEAGERIGIVGRNGTGKSTLLRALGRLLRPDGGSLTVQRGCSTGYLEQDPTLDPEQTLRHEAGRAFSRLSDLHDQLDAVFEEMAGADGATLEGLLRRQARIEQEIEAAGGYAVDHRIDAVLHGLGFGDAQFTVRVSALSGGQRSRLALAKLLLEDPAVILLDEPTNHLDLAGREWLEGFLRDEYRGAVVMVSHDRYLLDRVVHRIVEVEHGRLIDYPGNYSAFRKLRAERRLAQLRAYEKQQTQFKREEAFIRQYKAGQRAKQARGRESRLERAKTDAIERPLEMEQLRLALPRAERTGDIVASGRGLTKKYRRADGSEQVLFEDFDVQIGRGERWAIIGPNGAGKTTLIRTLLGEVTPDAGRVSLGTKLQIGYFAQSHEGLDPEWNVYRAIQRRVKDDTGGAVLLSEQEARNIAGAFLFSGQDQEKELGLLSGGERVRTVLAALLASAKNVLVLDEPTNHLDIPAAERLEAFLARPHTDPKTGKTTGGTFDGALVLISHDRALIDATCDHLIALDGLGGAKVFPGTYSQWHQHQEAQAPNDAAPPRGPRRDAPSKPPATPAAARSAARSAPGRGPDARPEPARKNPFSWMRADQLEEKIGEFETRTREIDAELAEPSVWTDPDRANTLTEERDRLATELGQLEEEWLRKAT